MLNGLLLFLKALELFWIVSDELLSQSPAFYIIGSIVIALAVLGIIDVMTALAEVRSH